MALAKVASMRVPQVFTGGSAVTNGYLITTENGAILIDAPLGCAAWLRKLGVKPSVLLLTHQHYDHVEDAAAVVAWADCPIYAFADYSRDLTLEILLTDMGWPMNVEPFVVNRRVACGETFEVAGVPCEVHHIPGHATDGVVFLFPDDAVAYVGDTLFAGGVGRTDLPGGSWDTLLDGMRKHLLELPAETRVFPGHGEATTIGRELRQNAFLHG